MEAKTYYRVKPARSPNRRLIVFALPLLDSNLHSFSRQLIELRIEHADLDATIDLLVETVPRDELLLQRLKKRRLALRDQIVRVERMLDPQEPA
jgi:hypothetical protein